MPDPNSGEPIELIRPCLFCGGWHPISQGSHVCIICLKTEKVQGFLALSASLCAYLHRKLEESDALLSEVLPALSRFVEEAKPLLSSEVFPKIWWGYLQEKPLLAKRRRCSNCGNEDPKNWTHVRENRIRCRCGREVDEA